LVRNRRTFSSKIYKNSRLEKEIKKIMLNLNSVAAHQQIPLIHVVHEDDELLANSPDAEWYKILQNLPWEQYRSIAADYYNALYHFNKSKTHSQKISDLSEEQKETATQRLLFDRATMDETAPVLSEEEFITDMLPTVCPSMIAPGITPDRLGGKKPKCFFALFNSFIGASLMGLEAIPEKVHLLLTSNLSFARVCGFIPKGDNDPYWFKYVPSIRKLEQFDQIMTDYGLWDRLKIKEVIENLEQGIIKEEKELVGDTTHFHAYSGFETVTYIDEKGKEQRKSQSKTTKNCRCEDKDNCEHLWELADDGAGTIVKAFNKYIWGHKASILGLPMQGIPLDAIAVADAATHDGETFFPHVVRLFAQYPQVRSWIETVLYDSACDSQPLKEKFLDQLGIELKASLNPRRKKTVTENLPKGMKKLTAYGNLVCNADFEMDYKGVRNETEKFIYQAPLDADEISVCDGCEQKPVCCPTAEKGRIVQVSFDMLAHIDSQDPPMAKRFKAIMKRRPSVERMIKRLKCDLGDDRLKKRSNASFQAYLDKTMIAFHILLRS
jgi:uncharacterized glyoxalase superfamily protein PhnB